MVCPLVNSSFLCQTILLTIFSLIPTPALITMPLLSLAVSLSGAEIFISMPWIVRLPTGPQHVCVPRVTVQSLPPPGLLNDNDTSQMRGCLHPWTLYHFAALLLYACCFLLSMAGSVCDLDLRWLMRCHTDKLIMLMLLVKDSDALHLSQWVSVLLHVFTDNEALDTSGGPFRTTTWRIHGLWFLCCLYVRSTWHITATPRTS